MVQETAPRSQILQEQEVLRHASSANRKVTCPESVLMKKQQEIVLAVEEEEEEEVLKHALNVEKKGICQENVLIQVQEEVEEIDLQ